MSAGHSRASSGDLSAGSSPSPARQSEAYNPLFLRKEMKRMSVMLRERRLSSKTSLRTNSFAALDSSGDGADGSGASSPALTIVVNPLRDSARHQGWLWKRGVLNRSWKRRYMCLQGLKLEYYEKRGGKPLGHIDLHYAYVLNRLDEPDAGKYPFQIVAHDRVWHLAAASQEECKHWAYFIAEECRKRREALNYRVPVAWLGELDSFSIATGETYMFGLSSVGQLGVVDRGVFSVPISVPWLSGALVSRVACGPDVTAFVSRGELFVVGAGDNGVLGNGSTTAVSVARPLDCFEGRRVRDVAVSSCAVALCEDGSVYWWGADSCTSGSMQMMPAPVRFPGRVPVTAVAVGLGHMAAIAEGGGVFCWGAGAHGQLGHGGTFDWATPRQVDFLRDVCVVDVACGALHTVVVADDGRAFAFGCVQNGRLGVGERDAAACLPEQVRFSEDDDVRVLRVACGSAHTLFLSDQQFVYACGWNERGQLGIGTTDDAALPTLVRALKKHLIHAIACGHSHSSAITLRGELLMWGAGESGQLGGDKTSDRPLPGLVTSIFPVRSVACGSHHTAVLGDCTVYCDQVVNYVGDLRVAEGAVLRHGRGRHFASDAGKYTGQFVADEREGYGVFKDRAAGVRYKGRWLHDAWSGFGALKTAAFEYNGGFRAGQRHGLGVCRHADGAHEQQCGRWADDEFCEPAPEAAAVLRGDAASRRRISDADSPCSSSLSPLGPRVRHSVVRDRYGFQTSQLLSALAVGSESAASSSAAEVQRRAQWTTIVRRFSGDGTSSVKGSVLKQLVRQGIPAELRGHVWPLLFGSARLRELSPTMYSRLSCAGDSGVDESVLVQVDKDLNRTFPKHILFEMGHGQLMLRRVLLAFARFNPSIGYCQSMNFLCAFLLLVMDEESAFWTLVRIVELVPNYFDLSLSGVMLDLRVFSALAGEKLPRLAAHLRSLDVDVSAFATQWFMCLFVKSLSSEAAMRVWDAFAMEGPKVIFRMALACLRSGEQRLLACRDISAFLESLQQHIDTVTPDTLLNFAFKGIGVLKWTKIEALRSLLSQQQQQQQQQQQPQ